MNTVGSWLLAALLLVFMGSVSSGTLTQSPRTLSAQMGETVSMSCTASEGVDDDLSWYHQKPGQPPKFLFYKVTSRSSDTPSRYRSSGSEPDFTLTINRLEAGDVGEYFCLGVYPDEYTFGGGTQLIVDLGVQKPALTVLPPSREELQRGSATLLCVASGGFPSDWTLGWRVGGASTEGSHSPGVVRGDGLYSHISVLRLSTEQWRDTSVSCEAHRSGQSPVTQSLESLSCSQ